MSPPVRPTASDFLWQFQRLLPRGRIWHRGWGTVQAQHLLTLMPTWVRLTGRASDLIADAFPCTTDELLPEWEASLGLPDPCTGPLATLQERTAAVCAKFSASGGQSIAYFEELAARLGFEIEIVQFQPFRVDVNRVGQPLYSRDWAFAWEVLGPEAAIVYFRAGVSSVGEPLRSWGNELLECSIRNNAPAHTTVFFAYGRFPSVWDEGASIWDAMPPTTWDAGATTWDGGMTLWDATAEDASVWDEIRLVP